MQLLYRDEPRRRRRAPLTALLPAAAAAVVLLGAAVSPASATPADATPAETTPAETTPATTSAAETSAPETTAPDTSASEPTEPATTSTTTEAAPPATTAPETTEATTQRAPSTAAASTPARADFVDTWGPDVRRCADAADVDCLQRIDFVSGGLTRSAHVYLPPQAATRSVPMIVVAHGINLSPRSLDRQSGWTTVARREGFAVTFPQGYTPKPSATSYVSGWNAGWCCGAASEKAENVDDVAAMDATVRTAQTVYPTNGKVYFVGFSNGAMLGYRLQCTDRGLFAAFVAVHGTSSFATCQPRASRPFLAVHALLDTSVPYGGCRIAWRTGSCALVLDSDLNSARGTLLALRQAAGCTGVQTRRYAPHVVRSVSTGCRQPGPTQLTINNAHHTWVTDAAVYGIDETEEAWRFLRQF
jgi:polyhydroxybutyrate depolymerase